MKNIFRLTAVLMASACTFSAVAAVTAEEAQQLGGPKLTQLGSEKAGNKEGTIPEYAGVGPKAPADWDPKDPGRRPDPYGEKPLFTITAQNANKYADKLDGMAEVFKRFPNFRMDVYPSHRNYVAPKYVLDNTVKNATACKTINNELMLDGCYGGLPFPIPKTGNQAMWNHLIEFESFYWQGKTEAYVVPMTGNAVLVDSQSGIETVPWYDPEMTSPRLANAIYWRYKSMDTGPARMAGGQLILIDPVDQLGVGRRAYSYIPGQRRVKLAPDLAYDTPSPYAGGSATMDDAKVFLGALDRFDFKLIGKKEKYIYNNNYKMTDSKACSSETLYSTKGFPNPDCVRWELHRVWVVEATLKAGARHIYHKRIFYWDEDNYIAGQAENYDAGGKLYRIINNVYYPFFETPGGTGGGTTNMDLQTGIWSSQGLTSCAGCGWWPVNKKVDPNIFSPDGMAGAGVR